jgi:hypothetical protein
MTETEKRLMRLLRSALAALEKIPTKMRNGEQKYCIEQIEKEINISNRRGE